MDPIWYYLSNITNQHIQIVSDVGIWLSFLVISVFLSILLFKRRNNLHFKYVIGLFTLFIFCCGTTHLVNALAYYYPTHAFLGIMKFVTATIAWATLGFFGTRIPAMINAIMPFEEEYKNLKLVADLIPQIVWSCGQDGKVDYLNNSWYELTGDYKNRLNPEAWKNCIHPEDRGRVDFEWREAVTKRQGFKVECRLRTDIDYRWYLATCMPAGNQKTRWVGTWTDIHDIKVFIREREKEAEELMVTNKELEMFAYVASHDLQDPLRRMNAFLKMMFAKFPNREMDEYKEVILQANDNMKRMTSSLLDYARNVNKPLDVGEFDMPVMMNQVISTLAHHIKNTRAVIAVKDLPKFVWCDGIQFARVWQNLLKNSIKYRREDVEPRIEVGGADLGDLYSFYVKDNGAGIDKNDVKKLFVVFRRLSKDDKGVGFGLAICKKIVEKHRGKIWVESEKGVGTTFRFTIPKLTTVATEHSNTYKKFEDANTSGEFKSQEGVNKNDTQKSKN